MKKLRQGQTVYWVDARLYMGPHAVPKLVCHFLYSYKTPLPSPGAIIEKLPVTHAIWAQRRGFKFYTSRRKAERALRVARNV